MRLRHACNLKCIPAWVCLLAALAAAGLRPENSAASAERKAANLFFSGHSLTDNPLPEYVAAIAKSQGAEIHWNQQNIPGSPIRVRSLGSGGWVGYSSGKNAHGQGLNVIDELRRPRTLGNSQRYDTLIIAERHDLIGPLQWEDSVRLLRHFHERLIDGNPEGTTYFYESWAGVADKNKPAEWIAYERAASPMWQCIGTRINTSLAAERRSDRIQPLPAGAALASLVERATQKPGLTGITASSDRQTLNNIFSDDVHLTPLSTYYIALVTFATVYQRSPEGAWAPPEVKPEQAKLLQSLAWEQVRSKPSPWPLEKCRAVITESFCSTFWRFFGKPQEAPNCAAHFAKRDSSNPFHYDAATDASYWLPAP